MADSSRIPSILDALPEDWAQALRHFNGEQLNNALEAEYSAGYEIYPPQDMIFRAFSLTPFEKVRALWLGQDPYHEPEQAMGVAFAVPDHVKVPPSLRNIFKEYESDLGKPAPSTTTLNDWAEQGVLLLNTALTVRAHSAGSHRKIGWYDFTKAVIKAVSSRSRPCVFILLGADAARFEEAISGDHPVFKAAHPSPLSAYRGFFGCRLFSEVNRMLVEKGESPLNW